MAPSAGSTIGGDAAQLAAELQRATRNRRRTEKAEQHDTNQEILTESDEPALPATPKKQTSRGKTIKHKDPNHNLLISLLEMIKEMKMEGETRAARTEEKVEHILQKMTSLEERVTKLEEGLIKLSKPNLAPISYASAARSGNAPPSTEPSSQPSSANSASVNPSSSASRYTTPASITINLSNVKDQLLNTEDAGAVRHRVKTALAASINTADISNCRLNKDASNPKKYKLLFSSKEDERRARKYNEWFTSTFEGATMGGDQWFPVKVDSVRKADVVRDNKIANSIREELGKENGMEIKHIKWISRSDSTKEYGSMIIYLGKEEEAHRLLSEGFMDIYNLAAYTREYVPNSGPTRCFKCQRFGHRAPRCQDSAPTCSTCAEKGHEYHSCSSSITKCANCKDSHSANDPNCPELTKRKNALAHYHV